MKLDVSPFIHAIIAMAIQTVIGLCTGQWFLGGVVGCALFIAREHTQAEYRWIEKYGNGHRINMPWYGGFDYRIWDLESVLDFAVPILFCLTVTVSLNT